MPEKLVRDNIPEIIKSKGENADIKIASDSEYTRKLNEKLLEEVNEFLETPTKEELADIQEVIEAITKNNNWTEEELRLIKNRKAKERGKFNKKIVLIS